jgi:hypothetical protein
MATKKKQAKAEIVPAPAPAVADPDLSLVQSDGLTIAAFFQGAIEFFRKARSLEEGALAMEASSKTLQKATDADSDKQLQAFVLKCSDDIKEVEAHWSICQAVSRLHRKLTARRGLSVDALERAKTKAQTFHNEWVESERRRVAREAELERQRQEQLAREQRERELAALEDKALEAEAAMDDLSERERIFVDHIERGFSPARAAQGAGYQNPNVRGPKLLESPKVAKVLEENRKAKAAREQAAALKAAPVEVIHVERPAMEVSKPAGGAKDVTRWSGEILDEAATIEAFRSGQYGIPGDLFQINPTKLNEYARSLEARLDLWPGVRAKKNVSTQR